ncbi:MAG: hypothetical protein MSIBF_01500 [Candidatus Altiarchaeales archaeon IMC4]|nr:MAG: hypothetical protein MSIBF_01500 [Candidatus Altiarchaeales archaeon IMC4]
MDIETLKKKYHGEWIAAKVLKENENREVTEAELITHNKDRRDLHRELREKHVKDAYVTYAGPVIKPGYSAMFNEIPN